MEATSARNGYQFRCKVTNPVGTAYSDAATLTVMAKPKFTAQPNDVHTAPGQTASFTVTASGEDLSYQWYFMSPSNYSWRKCSDESATTNTLNVAVKSYHDGYSFYCKVSNPAGSVNSREVELYLVEMPVILSSYGFEEYVCVGSTEELHVGAYGENLSYQWYYRKTPDSSWTKSGCDGATSPVLHVIVKNYHEGYQFRCKVSNVRGSVYSEVYTIHLAPAPTMGTLGDLTVLVDDYEYFECDVYSEWYDLDFQWYYRTSSNGSWQACADGTNELLRVEGILDHDGYQYRCKVSCAAGDFYTNVATLHVITE